MATRCPECGMFMDHLGTGKDPSDKRKNLSHFWCPHDGTYTSNGKVKTPKLKSAYQEFKDHIQSAGEQQWRTVFFQQNDSRRLGVMIDQIMGIHPVIKIGETAFAFDVTTTSCQRISFTYAGKAVAAQDRERLIKILEAYHDQE